MNKYNIAIVGATGLVGSMFIKVLDEYNIPINNLYCFASRKSAGKTISFKSKSIVVEELTKQNITNKKIDFALFSAGGKISKAFANIFIKNGATVIDNSSAFRMDKNVPLIVPEVNKIPKNSHLIANPNCSTIQCMLPLKILHDNFILKSVDFTTFQAVSGSGIKGINDLKLTSNGLQNVFYPHPIFNNCLPHIGNFDEYGWTEEELKMINESKKILKLPQLKVSATCVRVPVYNSHSIAIKATFKNTVNLELVEKQFLNTKGLKLLNNCIQNIYPLATLASGSDDIFVGRLRRDLFCDKTIHFFCVADNIRKGASSNAVQILQSIISTK